MDDIYNFESNAANTAYPITSYGTRSLYTSTYSPQTRQQTMAGRQSGVRPVTSNRAAGFTAQHRTSTTHGTKGYEGLSSPGIRTEETVPQKSPEEQIKGMEKKIMRLIDDSIKQVEAGNPQMALELAKEAGARERKLTRFREQTLQSNPEAKILALNLDIMFLVLMNLAECFLECKMYQEALNTYSAIAKNKMFHQAGRMRVNMGNIYMEQGKYHQALKVYRMALDQIPNTNKSLRLKILKNIGVAQLRMGHFQDAIVSFDTIVDGSGDLSAGLNLILCYIATGDKEKMGFAYQKIANVKTPVIDHSDNARKTSAIKKVTEQLAASPELVNESGSDIDESDLFANDPLRSYSREKRRQQEHHLILASRLAAQHLNSETPEPSLSVYDWVVSIIRDGPNFDLAADIEMIKAIDYLKNKEFSLAVQTLKSFENKDIKMVGTAATNLSFLYLLEGDAANADKYATISVHCDRYNARALINKGNCQFLKGDCEKAKASYMEALNNDALCVEAIYNLGMINKRNDQLEEALIWFEKFHGIVQDQPEVIFHIADIHERMGQTTLALEWYNILASIVPTDPEILLRLGKLLTKENDKSQAYHYFSESYRYFPSNIEVITWLGTYYIECELYENAIQYFKRAWTIDHSEPKWGLMVASCYRQSGNHQKAYEMFRQVHSKFPENVECLKSLIKMATDMGKDAAKEWSDKLLKLERQDDSRAATGLSRSSGQGQSSTLSLRESARTPKSENNSGWSMTSQDRMMGTSSLDLEEKKTWADNVTDLLPE